MSAHIQPEIIKRQSPHNHALNSEIRLDAIHCEPAIETLPNNL
ncbi:hypothetical protein [Stakelama flava]|nr:hypothetical protein [Stakelama flava]